jgi:hypothetical protein
MMRSAAWSFSCLTFAALGGFLLSTAPARGQAGEGDEFLPAEKLSSQDASRFRDLKEGRVAYKTNEDENRRVLELAAQYYVNRLTRAQYRQGTPDRDLNATKMAELVREANRLLPDYKARKELEPNQQVFVEEFSRKLIKQIEAVLKTPWPISRVNAAMILAHLGKVGSEESADAMVKIINDPQQLDAVKLYALRGLKDLFALQQIAERPFQFKDKEREFKCIQALLKFLDRPAEQAAGAPPDEVEALKDGYRWVRREAIMALAETRYPGLVDPRDPKKKVREDGQTAWKLLRICCADGVNPEPSPAERLEAAIAVCRLDPKLTPSYQVDYVIHAVGWVLRDYALRYNPDFRDTKGKSFLWKYGALRFSSALHTLKGNLANVRDKKAVDYTSELIAKYDSGLGIIEKEQQFVDDVYLKSLEDSLASRLPAATSVYQDVPASTVKQPTAAGK